MKELVSTIVSIGEDADATAELTVTVVDGVFKMYLDGVVVFTADWVGNIETLFWKAMQRWTQLDWDVE